MKSPGDARILLIGYGNLYRGDDGIGWLTAQALADRPHAAGVQITACHQLTPELAADVAPAQLVIFIDASLRGRPGEIMCLPVARASNPCHDLTHHLDPAALLALAHQVFRRTPRAYVFSVGGEFFGYRQGLSDSVRRAQEELIHRIEVMIDWWQRRIAPAPAPARHEQELVHA
jgi:hydrogenase maturation protease